MLLFIEKDHKKEDCLSDSGARRAIKLIIGKNTVAGILVPDKRRN